MQPSPSRALEHAVYEVEQYAGRDGWDAAPRLFALVPTAELVAAEPSLAAQLGDAPVDPDALTPIEQEDLPEAESLDALLAGIAWPGGVIGAALVVERLVLPPEAEVGMPQDEQEALDWLAQHPQREEVRVAVGVLRDGPRACVLRMRTHEHEVLKGPDLVPALADALAATLEE